MDPLQPLPRRPKKSATGAWLLALGLAALAALVLWLNLRPRRVTLQQRVEQIREHGRELLSGSQGSAAGQTDPAVRTNFGDVRQPGRPSDLPSPATPTSAKGKGKKR